MPAQTVIESEPNNTYTVAQADSAGVLSPDQPLVLLGSLNGSNDPIDYFTFTPTTSGTVEYTERLHDYQGEHVLEGTFEVQQGQPAGFYCAIDEFYSSYSPDYGGSYDVNLFLVA